ncbi:MAG: macro domain-containing protein [Promethearchaeota archaeon]
MKEIKIKNSFVKLIKGDITDQEADAIVNAANSELILGSGVAGAIRKKGGPSIQEECNKIGPIKVGEAAITSGGKLKARHVIHAVGPRLGEGNEDEKLKMATINSLKLMDEYSLKSIVFPAISTGVFGYPIESCARIMLNTTAVYLDKTTKIDTVYFCLFSNEDYNVFSKELKQLEAKNEK